MPANLNVLTQHNHIMQLVANTVKVPYGETSSHNLLLFSLVCAMQPKTILELGTRRGVSTFSLLVGCKQIGAKLTSVDIAKHKFNCPEDLQPYWTFIRQDALRFLHKNKQAWDIILIDDWHASEHVYKELCFLHPLVTTKTLILLHDLMHTSSEPVYNQKTYPEQHQFGGTGPYGGVKKFLAQYPNYEFATIPICHGMTILRKVT